MPHSQGFPAFVCTPCLFFFYTISCILPEKHAICTDVLLAILPYNVVPQTRSYPLVRNRLFLRIANRQRCPILLQQQTLFVDAANDIFDFGFLEGDIA